MRIFIDITPFVLRGWTGGVRRVVVELSRYLAAHTAHTLTFICWHGMKQEFLRVPFPDIGVNCRAEPMPWQDIRQGDLFLDLSWGDERPHILTEWVRRGGWTAAFIHDLIPVSHSHLMDKNKDFLSALSYLGAHFNYDRLQFFSTCHVRDSVHGIFSKAGVTPPPGHVIGLGCELPQKTAECEIPLPSKPYLLFVGRLEKRKNLSLLQVLHQEMKDSFDFVLIGEWMGEEPYAEEKLKNAILAEDGIRRYGRVTDDELAAWYKHSFLFLFPSWTEGFGLPVAEALAYGTPIIASDIAELHEVGGGCCRYANPAKPEEWIKMIRELDRNKSDYNAWRSSLSGYKPLSWLQVGARLAENLDEHAEAKE